jgi:hypothetical protein
MRSSRIARQIARITGGIAVSAILIGGVAAAPASAAHGVVSDARGDAKVVRLAHGV